MQGILVFGLEHENRHGAKMERTLLPLYGNVVTKGSDSKNAPMTMLIVAAYTKWKRITVISFLGIGFAIISAASHAQDEKYSGHEVGPGFIYPAVGVELSYDDNIFQASTDEVSSPIVKIKPLLRYDVEAESSRFRLEYSGDYGAYTDSSDDDYVDHRLFARAAVDITRKTELEIEADLQKEHDPRGTFRTQGAAALSSEEPDEWHGGSVGGVLRYGRRGAIARIDLKADAKKKQYDNNRVDTVFFDRDEITYGGTFYVNLQPSTDILVEATHTDHDYDVSDLDSTNLWYAAGITWEVTNATTGTMKYGRREKNFDSPANSDFEGGGWEVDIVWQPRTYSTFTFSAARTTEETNGFGNFVLIENYRLIWDHSWTGAFGTSLDFFLSDEEYQEGATPRQDDIADLRFGLEFFFRPTLKFGIAYRYIDRDSTSSEFDFTSNQVSLSADGVF